MMTRRLRHIMLVLFMAIGIGALLTSNEGSLAASKNVDSTYSPTYTIGAGVYRLSKIEAYGNSFIAVQEGSTIYVYLDTDNDGEIEDGQEPDKSYTAATTVKIIGLDEQISSKDLHITLINVQNVILYGVYNSELNNNLTITMQGCTVTSLMTCASGSQITGDVTINLTDTTVSNVSPSLLCDSDITGDISVNIDSLSVEEGTFSLLSGVSLDGGAEATLTNCNFAISSDNELEYAGIVPINLVDISSATENGANINITASGCSFDSDKDDDSICYMLYNNIYNENVTATFTDCTFADTFFVAPDANSSFADYTGCAKMTINDDIYYGGIVDIWSDVTTAGDIYFGNAFAGSEDTVFGYATANIASDATITAANVYVPESASVFCEGTIDAELLGLSDSKGAIYVNYGTLSDADTDVNIYYSLDLSFDEARGAAEYTPDATFNEVNYVAKGSTVTFETEPTDGYELRDAKYKYCGKWYDLTEADEYNYTVDIVDASIAVVFSFKTADEESDVFEDDPEPVVEDPASDDDESGNPNDSDSSNSNSNDGNQDDLTSSDSSTTTTTTTTNETTTIGAAVGTTATVGNLKYKVTKAATSTTAGELTLSTVVTKSKQVIIPDRITISGATYKVTAIADNAFKGNTKMTSLVIGSNVTTIGKNAFKNCKNLTKVSGGKALVTIKANAFANCKNLKSFTCSSTVLATIGNKAFYKCKKLATIKLSTKSLKKVGKKAIKGIKSTAVIKVPKAKVKAYKKLFKSKTGFKKTMKIKKK